MNNRSTHYRTALRITGWLVLYLLFTFFLQAIGRYNFCYLEQWGTCFYDTNYIASIMAYPGGFAQLIAKCLMQFFIYPIVGVLITAFLLTWISGLIVDILYKWTDSYVLLPFSVLPAIALAFLHFNVNYQYAGTVAFLLMLGLLRLFLYFRNLSARLVYAIGSTLLLFVIAGPISLLYAGLVLVVELFRHPKQAMAFISLALLVVVAGEAALWLGFYGDLKQAILPDGYFTLRLPPGSVIYLPWGLTILVFLLGGIGKFIRRYPNWIKYAVMGLQLAVLGGVLYFGTFKYIDTHNEFFKELNYYARDNRWEDIRTRCQEKPMNNLLYQNYLNVALAETGRLGDALFFSPSIDIRSIYVTANKTPYISALLSDVYFSMGHLALSQRYAFEANESVGNYSPRMLQRLVQTNLVFGYYETARKYLSLLEKTLFYREWAIQHRRFLWNDKAVEDDAVLGPKRRCIFPDNRFAGYLGLDDDLKQIIQLNPAHKATIQYLSSLYLLSKDLEGFRSTLEQFYDTPALSGVLPVFFQEGVLAFAEGDRDVLAHYQIQEANIQRFDAFKQRTLKDKQTLWHFLKYKN
jgi:hypothetical protein